MLVASIKQEPLRQQNFHLCLSPVKYPGASLPLKSIYGLCFNPFLKLPLKSVGEREAVEDWVPAGEKGRA